MTFKEAKENYLLHQICVYRKKRNGKVVLEDIGEENYKSVPDEAEGKIGICDASYTIMPAERLAFVLNEWRFEK